MGSSTVNVMVDLPAESPGTGRWRGFLYTLIRARFLPIHPVTGDEADSYLFAVSVSTVTLPIFPLNFDRFA
jgi:hypothetical protein